VTVGIVYRLPGHGAVLACDGRVTNDNGGILTDQDEKWIICGSIVAVCAGNLGGLWIDLKDNVPKNWKEFRARITDKDAQHKGVDYEIMAYDRVADRIVHTDHHGDALLQKTFATVGCGGPVAAGALDASPAPRSLEAAARACESAARHAIKRNAFCGGRVRVLTVPSNRRAQVSVR
jgi:20S proteasome alpha/beta subunit